LNEYVKKGNSKSKSRIFIVHRLDRDTSGVLVFAKTEVAKRYLQDNWKEFHKTYFAVVHGNFNEKKGLITSYLTENSVYRVYSTKDKEKGKLSTTGYKVIKESKNYSLLEINLLTGRKNQIRVHLSEKDHPVVGDKMYGDKGKGVKRLALHAASLTILHPFSKEEMTFKTELPVFMKNILKN
jgi:23S rRNA pseudouridine1911/1915/1917 synthase